MNPALSVPNDAGLMILKRVAERAGSTGLDDGYWGMDSHIPATE